jgi:hypothetical protein
LDFSTVDMRVFPVSFIHTFTAHQERHSQRLRRTNAIA